MPLLGLCFAKNVKHSQVFIIALKLVGKFLPLQSYAFLRGLFG